MIYKIKLVLLTLLLVVLPAYGICDWSVVKYDTVFGTTDKLIKIRWGHESSNQYHIEVRFIVAPTNSSEVTYNIYDGDATEPIYTTIMDQTDIEKNDKWVLLGWYHAAFTGTIRVEATNANSNLCIDAVRLSSHRCRDTIVISNERDDNTVFTGVWETISTGGYDGSYVVSNGIGTHVWTFNNLAISNNKLSFDYYFQQVETETNLAIKHTDQYTIEEMLPKSGHYIFFSRSRVPFNAGRLESYNRAHLININITCRCEVDITEEMTIEEIKNLMYESGKHSVWVNTSMEDITLHDDCSKKAFWVYGYIAPPGPIVLE